MDTTGLLGFGLAVVVLNLVPGPGMMFVVAHGVAGGRRAGLAAAAGMASGTVVHTVAAALGLSALLQAAPFALNAVRIVGAVVLVYLAIDAFRRAKAASAVEPRRVERSLRRTYASAVLTNLANPKVVLFYLSFVPQFITPGGWPAPAQILLLGLVLILIGLVMDGLVGTMAGTFSALMLRRPAVERGLRRLSGVIFGALAVKLLSESS